MSDFKAHTLCNQATLLGNYSNHIPLWLNKVPTLDNRYKRSFTYLGEILFSSKLVKLYTSAQDLVICNSLMKWPNYRYMTFIHGLGISALDYGIYNMPLYNRRINLGPH